MSGSVKEEQRIDIEMEELPDLTWHGDPPDIQELFRQAREEREDIACPLPPEELGEGRRFLLALSLLCVTSGGGVLCFLLGVLDPLGRSRRPSLTVPAHAADILTAPAEMVKPLTDSALVVRHQQHLQNMIKFKMLKPHVSAIALSLSWYTRQQAAAKVCSCTLVLCWKAVCRFDLFMLIRLGCILLVLVPSLLCLIEYFRIS
mgnify:CR=1 FL=1